MKSRPARHYCCLQPLQLCTVRDQCDRAFHRAGPYYLRVVLKCALNLSQWNGGSNLRSSNCGSNHDNTHHRHFYADIPPLLLQFIPPTPTNIIRTSNVNAISPGGVIAASASADFTPPSPTRPITNFYYMSTSAGCYTSNTASSRTPKQSTTRV